MGIVKCRLIHIVARKIVLDSWTGQGQCANKPTGLTCHATKVFAQVEGDVPLAHPKWDDALDAVWPYNCDACGRELTREEARRSMGARDVFNTPTGKPEIGDMWFERHGLSLVERCHLWDNCPGEHLHVMLPDGTDWDVDSRAGNCSMPADKLHRCWQRTGAAPNVTAGKSQPTCQAGAGSIATGQYHGFLVAGELRPTPDSKT